MARKHITDFALALFAVTLMFGPQFGSWARATNRFYIHWERANGLALIADILLLALLATLLAAFLRRPGREKAWRAYRFLYLLALGTALVALIPKLHFYSTKLQIAWWGMAAVVLALYLFRAERAVMLARSASLLFIFLVPVIFLQLLAFSPYGSPPETYRPLRKKAPQAHPIVLILMDEWSYRRIAPSGTYLPSLPHMRELSREAFHFRNAQSGGTSTTESVPRLLYQGDVTVNLSTGALTHGSRGEPIPSHEVPSLFKHARQHGYNTALVGFYLPYRYLLADQVDYIVSYPHWPNSPRFLDKMLLGLVRNFRYWGDPLSQIVGAPLDKRIELLNWRNASHDIHAMARRLLRECPANSLVFIHSPGCHPPFVFHADGSYTGFWSDRYPHDYLGQSVHVDRMVGDLMATLKESGKYDDALIILFSDHGWKFDPDPAIKADRRAIYHVPLLVKWPGQRRGVPVERPVSLLQLGPLIETVMRGGSADDARKLIAGLPVPSPPWEHHRTILTGMPTSTEAP